MPIRKAVGCIHY